MKLKLKKTKLNKYQVRAYIEFKIREFFRILPYHILVMGSVFIVATIFHKYIEAVFFLTAFFSIRYKFNTTYHSDNMVICMVMTISMFTLSIIFSLPIYTSIFSTVIAAFIDAYILWYIRDKKDQIDKNKELTKELEIKNEKPDIFKMSEEELRNYAKSNGLSEQIIDTLVLKVVHNYKWVEIQQERNYTKEGIRYHKEKIKEKLHIKL